MSLPLSALDLIPLASGGTSHAALVAAVDIARTVERLGFARLWYAEHHNMPGIATRAACPPGTFLQRSAPRAREAGSEDRSLLDG
jgi:alkanesulfonate monooxygenase SsuD/methylene tetrahydromethanopterin reductase-like flavin-dependent oxidoreductase (luciferase family)